MSEVTKFHPGDTVYCLNLEGVPIKAVVRHLDSTDGIVMLNVGPQARADDAMNAADYLPLSVLASDCYSTLDELIDRQITKHKYMIAYWESIREAQPI